MSRNDRRVITKREWQSHGLEEGLRNRNALLSINGNKTDAKSFNELLSSLKTGDKVKIGILTQEGQKEKEIQLGKKKESSYAITPVTNPDPLQAAILETWLNGK